VQDEVVVKAISDSNKGVIATPPVSQDEAKQRATPSAVEKPPSDLALTLGDVESDRAGNLYVLRHSSPATIYVFDQNGNYQRKLSVAGPDPKRLAVTSMLVAPARLALTFEQVGDVNNPERVISIVDSTSGDELSRYSAGAELGSGPVCMTDNEFEFLTATPDAALVLDRVSLP
jgi:hypothetical protein